MCWFAVLLRETKGESFQLSPSHLLLCAGGKGFFFPCRTFLSVLMNSCMAVVNNVLVVGASEICITVTIIEEALL